ncbi:unnamed protein product [Porites evermanni]|uniref:Uncharacterized protein n=1 Tax=Porites evermanni TaxID=104178 RepID=A0ABN8MPP1_9CNID|nr:unnamed protein product [Porites evermanni]
MVSMALWHIVIFVVMSIVVVTVSSLEKFTVLVSIKPGGTDEEFVSSVMSGGSEGSVVAEYEIEVYKKGAKANQLNGEKNPPAKAGVVIFGALLMGMVILAFILKILHQTWVRKRNSPEEPLRLT